jgi:hypothetical protein
LGAVKKIKIVDENHAVQNTSRSAEEYVCTFIGGTDVCNISNENICVSEEYNIEDR